MVEIGDQHAATPLENFANQKEVFLLIAHEQHLKWDRSGLGGC